MNQINTISSTGPLALILACALAALSFGCSADVAGTTPPGQALFYPTSMELSSDGRYVYVVNSNFNQTYSSGWLSLVDLDLVLTDGTTSSEAILSREDGGQIRIPGLGGELAISSDGSSALLPHRGLNARGEVMITRFDFGTDAMASCGDPDYETGFTGREAVTDCDEDHLIRVFENGSDDLDPTIMPRELTVAGQLENAYHSTSFTWTDADGSAREMVAIGYVTSGSVRFYEYSQGTYSFVDVLQTPLAVTGRLGFHPTAEEPFLIAGGGYNNVSQLCSINLVRSFSESDEAVYSHSLPSNGGRKIYAFDFTPDGKDLLVVNRSGLATGSPGTDSFANSLVRLDASLQRATEQTDSGEWDDNALRPAMTVKDTALLDGRATDVKAFTKA
ncbi:MAG: hypothetical protein HOI23_01845, partial [Deltaproteobacteria bacterium]|nr:hypothetical protein [Deltaproteobacteria bacterium]